MNESEAWTAIADVLEMTGEMPPFDDHDPCFGLCVVVDVMTDDGVICDELRSIMEARIRHEMNFRTGYLFKRYLVPPRLALCRRFAKESA